MNNCPSCGSTINPDEAFCRNCGVKISAPAPAPAPASASAPAPAPASPVNPQLPQSPAQPQLAPPTPPAQPIQSPIIVSSSQSQSPAPQNISSPDDDILIAAYIGKNTDELKKGDFSFCTLLFGMKYVLCRKMWLLGVLWLTISIIVVLFLPSIALISQLIIRLIVATQFKKLYLKNTTEQISKIKTKNPDKTKDLLLVMCSQEGGISLAIPTVIAVIEFYTLFSYLYLVLYDVIYFKS